MVSSTPRPHFTPGKDSVPILQEAGWAPGPVWTGGKSRPHRDSIPDRPARSSVAIPTELTTLYIQPHNETQCCQNKQNDLHSRSLHARPALANQNYSSRNTQKEILRPGLCTFSFKSFLTNGPFRYGTLFHIPYKLQLTHIPQIQRGPTYLSRYSDLVKDWAVRGSNPGTCNILRTRPDRPWGSASLLHVYRISFTG